jgi:hypothetical protein
MSIPLDRLYHYIESVARSIRGGDVIIYRFAPHGSKKIEDLSLLNPHDTTLETTVNPQIICYDQEPLNYNHYQNIDIGHLQTPEISDALSQVNVNYASYNLRCVDAAPMNIYDQCLILHSEQRSTDIKLYASNGFIPVYYWCHALLARDWFRYAQHISQVKKIPPRHCFLIYNRAWGGTREYRLKFLDLMIDHQLVSSSNVKFNPVDPEHNQYYKNHQFVNSSFVPTHQLEDYYKSNPTDSSASADFVFDDYCSAEFEVILETLFDDQRLHLTEKVLRPIACGQPFLLCATHSSLKYLHSYGFQTFDSVIDESYDTIVDPIKRLEAVVKVMGDITKWSDQQRMENMLKIQKIVDYNKRYFFSADFFNRVVTELNINFQTAFEQLEKNNTSAQYINLRKHMSKNSLLYQSMTTDRPTKTRKQTIDILTRARKYYNNYLAKSR